jgi:hypothetical protein
VLPEKKEQYPKKNKKKQSQQVASIPTNPPCGEKPSQGFFRAKAQGDKQS